MREPTVINSLFRGDTVNALSCQDVSLYDIVYGCQDETIAIYVKLLQ